MSTNTEYIEQLVFKFNTGNISKEELQVLTDWYNSHDDHDLVIPTTRRESPDEVRSRMLAGLLAKVTDEQSKTIKRYPTIRWVATVAAVLVVALGTWTAVEYKTSIGVSEQVSTSIEPGGNKATLTLANGKIIELSNAQAGIVTGKEITYTNGVPIENIDLDQAYDSRKLLILQTPRGGTYKITLLDGTQVWLNAASRIKYPSRFASDERIVELEGEAYFQVKPAYRKNGEKIPFKVISNHQEVEVLGTQFNINAYREQLAIKTTLVEGTVAVSANQDRVILSPNQQAIVSAGKTKVKQVDVADYIAWRDGKFSFDGKTFEETMSEIGRWYDLDIVYENGIPKEELIGDAYRNQKISLVLRLLDVAEIDYKLDASHRKLIIKGKK
ncbi:fec operon regulator FecR [compost metagenome]